MKKLAAAVALTLAGCATSTTEVMKIAPDTYMISGGAGYGVMSAGTVQAKAIREGTEFCEKQGKEFLLASTRGQDTYFGHPATAEIQFLCLGQGDPQLKRQTLMPITPASININR